MLRVHLRVDRERGCTSHAPGTPRATPEPPRRPRARRPHGRRLPAGVLLLWGVSCAPGVSAVVPHRRAGRQAACNMHVRVPAASGASACARSAPGHGRWRGTHTSRRRSSRSCPRAADPVCARGAGSPSRVLSLTHSLLRVLPATCPSRGHSGGAPTGEQMPVRPSAQPR